MSLRDEGTQPPLSFPKCVPLWVESSTFLYLSVLFWYYMSCLQFELLSYLKEKFKSKHRVSIERIISGPGIANV